MAYQAPSHIFTLMFLVLVHCLCCIDCAAATGVSRVKYSREELISLCSFNTPIPKFTPFAENLGIVNIQPKVSILAPDLQDIYSSCLLCPGKLLGNYVVSCSTSKRFLSFSSLPSPLLLLLCSFSHQSPVAFSHQQSLRQRLNSGKKCIYNWNFMHLALITLLTSVFTELQV